METLYIRVRGEVLGPLSREAAAGVFRERKLTPSHEVSHDGNVWFPASQIWDQLRGDAAIAPAPPRTRSPAAATSADLQPKPVASPPKPRKPPSAVTAPPPPAPRSQGNSRPPSDVRPPSIELSAEARIPTAEEIAIEPVPAGVLHLVLSALLSAAIVAQLVMVGIYARAIVRNQDLLGQLSGETLTKVMLDERRRELYQVLNQASFGVILGGIAVFVLYGFWIYHTDAILHRRKLRRLKFTRWWCVGWEIIPFANLWFPYQVLAEVWHGSAARTKINWRHRMPLLILLYGIVQLAIRVTRPYLQYTSYSLGQQHAAIKSVADVAEFREETMNYLRLQLGACGAMGLAYLLFLILTACISVKLRWKQPSAVAVDDAAAATDA